MMLEIMAYTIVVTALLTLVGHCLEHVAGICRLSRRKAWIAMMALSVMFPVAMILASRVELAPATTMQASPEELSAGSQSVAASPAQQAPIWKLAAPNDNQIIAMWLVASCAFGLYLFSANYLLRRRAASWKRAAVLDQEVLVSEVTGPALLGVLQPQIVVPRWLLQEPVTTQSLILEHERQHMRARDPLLAVAGLLLIAAIPWNLPLWWQWRRMRQAVEMDCDARVLGTGAEASSYADVLLEVTQRVTRLPPGTLAMSEPVSSLERRIDSLAPDVVRHAPLQVAAVLCLATAGTGMAIALDAPALPIMATKVPVATVPAVAALAPPTPAETPMAAPAPEPESDSSSVIQASNTENEVNKTRSIAVTVAALSAVTGAQAALAADAPAIAQAPAADGTPQRVGAEEIVANNDLNKDGVVTRAEATEVDGNLIFMWSIYDTDADGRIDVPELSHAMNDVAVGTALDRITGDAGNHRRAARPTAIITNNDQNADGIVTREEATASGKALIRMWDSYDLNKDGKVDAAEVGKAHGE